MTLDPMLMERARTYAANAGLLLNNFLGGGTDGNVWQSSRNTAVKALQLQKNFDMELGCYQRLKDHGWVKIGPCTVPRLVDWDAGLLIIEMEMVTPPYILDFGKAYLDSAPEHSEETWRDHEAAQREIWGDHYGDVQAILWRLESIGIYYRDPNPRNIVF
jgi:hypothetical protein